MGELARATHPGPTVVVTAIVFALGLAAGLEPWRLAALTFAVLCGQVSIGLSNDAIDASRDRVSQRPDKPLARPDAPLGAAWFMAIAAVVAAIVVSALLSWQLLLLHSVAIGAGWAYNALLKSTGWSAACFVVAFGALPSFAPLALPTPHVAPLWEWVCGAALGIAIHFSNVLPDLDDDARTGVRGLPHRMGRSEIATWAFCALILGAAAGLVGPILSAGAPPGPATWITAAGIVVLAVWGLVASRSPTPGRTPFRLVMAAGGLLAIQLVLTEWWSAR